ncbi:ComEC/Rec2 family competence protein [Bacillus sp. N9]
MYEAIRLDACQFSTNSFIAHLQNVRAAWISKVKTNIPDPLASYVSALIFGDRTAFTDEVYTAYQRIGVVHLLAISGLHIGLLIGFIYILLLRSGIERETIFWLLVYVLPIYAIISGGNPPVVRAVFMSLALLAAQHWRLPLTGLDAISISFFVLLFIQPYWIYHIDFSLRMQLALPSLFLHSKSSEKYLLHPNVNEYFVHLHACLCSNHYLSFL